MMFGWSSLAAVLASCWKRGSQLRVVGHVGRQDLDRHLPLKGQILGQENDRHAAAANSLMIW
jgi:hypothetical protein